MSLFAMYKHSQDFMKMMKVKVVYSTAISARLFAFPINTIKRSREIYSWMLFSHHPPSKNMINFCVMMGEEQNRKFLGTAWNDNTKS